MTRGWTRQACPRCGTWMVLEYARDREGGRWRYRWACHACGHEIWHD